MLYGFKVEWLRNGNVKMDIQAIDDRTEAFPSSTYMFIECNKYNATT